MGGAGRAAGISSPASPGPAKQQAGAWSWNICMPTLVLLLLKLLLLLLLLVLLVSSLLLLLLLLLLLMFGDALPDVTSTLACFFIGAVFAK